MGVSWVTYPLLTKARALADRGFSCGEVAKKLGLEYGQAKWLARGYGVDYGRPPGYPRPATSSAPDQSAVHPSYCACGAAFFGLWNGSQRCSLCLATAAQQMRRAA